MYAGSKQSKKTEDAVISQKDFMIYSAILMSIIGYLNHLVPARLETARALAEVDKVWTISALLVALNMVGFWVIMQLCLRRFNDIVGRGNTSRLQRTLIRVSLLSPLLGIQVFLLGLFLPGYNTSKVTPGPVSRFIVLTSSFVLIHAGYLAWAVYLKKIEFDPGRLHFVETTDTAVDPISRSSHPSLSSQTAQRRLGQSLREQIRIRAFGGQWEPGRSFTRVHVVPYLNPSIRMIVENALDMNRASILYQLMSDPQTKACPSQGGQEGKAKGSCYLSAFLALNEAEPFLSPLSGLIFEFRRLAQTSSNPYTVAATSLPQSDVLKLKGGMSPQQILHTQLASIEATMNDGFKSLENVITVVETSQKRRSIREATSPHGLLLVYGNWEIPVFEFIRDLQQGFIAKNVGEKIGASLPEMRKSLDQAKATLPPGMHAAFLKRFMQLSHRIDALAQQQIFPAAWTR